MALPVQITADSTCDLPDVLLEEYGVVRVPLYVNLGEEVYRDGEDVTPRMIFDYFDANQRLATTSAVNVAEYQQYFAPWLESGHEVVHVSISAELSSSYQHASLAAQALEGVYVVDSRNLSTGSGHLVLLAAEMAREGKGGAEIAATLETLKPRVDSSFLVDTLEYLHKGGRCSALAKMGANLLKLKPCIQVRDGSMGVTRKYRGKMHGCLLQYVEDRLADPNPPVKRRVFITGPLANPETVAAIREKLEAAGFEEIIATEAGGVITCHCGPGTIGVLFLRENPI